MLKLTCTQKELVKAIGESQKAVSSKTTVEVLRSFYLKAVNNTLTISGYDLELSISSTIDANVIEEGEVLIDARLFGDIIKKLPQAEISLSVNNSILTIEYGANSKFDLKCDGVEDYPALSKSEDYSFVELNQEEFKRMVQEVTFATSQDATKPVLMGVLVEFKEEQINLVGVDGYRLSTSNNNISTGIEGEHRVIIPAKALNNVKSLLSSGEKTFKLGFNDKYAIFMSERTTIISRLISGQFIDYERLIPKTHNTIVTTNKKMLLDAIERASLISSDKNNLVKLAIRDNTMEITSANSELGNVVENVDISLTGDYLDIGFNSRYMCDALKVIDTEEITLELTSNVNPCLIKPVYAKPGARKYTYLLLPVRIASI